MPYFGLLSYSALYMQHVNALPTHTRSHLPQFALPCDFSCKCVVILSCHRLKLGRIIMQVHCAVNELATHQPLPVKYMVITCVYNSRGCPNNEFMNQLFYGNKSLTQDVRDPLLRAGNNTTISYRCPYYS